MADRTTPEHAESQDRGFTLLETLIVVVTIGLIATTATAVIVVTLRTSPAAEVRVDDARSVQGLVTWLPQDVDAAPPDGFNRDTSYWPCAGTAPANSHNVVTAEWTEATGITRRFAASYRYEMKNSGWSMVRHICESVSSTAMSSSESINLTSELPPWNFFAPPATVEMCSSAITAGGTCPSADIIPATTTAPSEVLSMKLLITRLDGVVATIDAAPKNPDQDLADDPNASTNKPPTISQVNYTLQMYAGDTTTIDLATTHGASDPESDPISVALDSTEPVPSGITAVTSDPLNLTVTADPSLSAGTLSPALVLIVSDNNAGWVDATVTVQIIPQPNASPTATNANYALQMEAGEEITLPLGTTHGLTDANGDPLTVTVDSYPNSEMTQPQPGPTGSLDLDIKIQPSVPLGNLSAPILMTVADGNGGAISITIAIEIVAPVVNQPPTASPSDYVVPTAQAGDSITLDLTSSHGLSDPDGDPLSIASVVDPPFVTTTLDGGLDVTIDIDLAAPVGALSPVTLVIEDVSGASVSITVSITVQAPIEPPSDCVLDNLTVSPSTVDRQGGGSNAHPLKEDVEVSLYYSGSCDGLALYYDSGDSTGQGIAGRAFPTGPSPTRIVIAGKFSGGSEKWKPDTHTLTATTTSDIVNNSITTSLTVT